MSLKYTNEAEDKKIIEMYRTGEYSYQQIADQYNLSKSTVINIVKGYPYSQNKDQLHYKLRVAAKENLDKAIKDEDRAAKAALNRGNRAMYGVHLERYLLLLQMIQHKEDLYERLKAERLRHEKCAWECYANSQYSEFGYHAETWDKLTEVLADNAKSPWAILQGKELAKNKQNSVRFEGCAKRVKPVNKPKNTEKLTRVNFKISNSSWNYIRGAIGHYNSYIGCRNIFEGVIYTIYHCQDFCHTPKEYGSRITIWNAFNKWYHAGIFADLLELAPVCPELQSIESALIEIEKHRAIYGNGTPPTLKMIQEAKKKAEE
jgi:predicted DNA-binding protein YlxM (UPF0122 family)